MSSSLYTGVRIKVSFSASKEPVLLQQLSGGQKSLVALALIFAIQRCDPAPFYLFDEVDAALDEDSFLPALIKIMKAASAQFIFTTFKGEMINEAKKVFHVQRTPMQSTSMGFAASIIRNISTQRDLAL